MSFSFKSSERTPLSTSKYFNSGNSRNTDESVPSAIPFILTFFSFLHSFNAEISSILFPATEKYFRENFTADITLKDVKSLYDEISEKVLSVWDITLLNDLYAFVLTGLLKAEIKKSGVNPMIHGFVISALVVIVAITVEYFIGLV